MSPPLSDSRFGGEAGGRETPLFGLQDLASPWRILPTLDGGKGPGRYCLSSGRLGRGGEGVRSPDGLDWTPAPSAS
jgi:hypothetical protein